MRRPSRLARWFLVVSVVGCLPAFILRCDKAALNFQRGLLQGLGEDVGDILLGMIDTQELQ